MRRRPRGEHEDENGFVTLFSGVEADEYPEVRQWDLEYADECDRLAEHLAEKRKKHCRRFGRWYVEDGYLSTIIALPYEGKNGYYTGGEYDFTVDRMWEDWARHLKSKRWLGSRGHADLVQALAVLRAEHEAVGVVR